MEFYDDMIKEDSFCIIKRDNSSRYTSREVSLNSLDPERTLCFCFGGNGTTDETVLGKLLTIVQNGLGLKVEEGLAGSSYDVDLAGVVYPLEGFFKSGALNRKMRADLSKDLLLRRVLDDNGERLSFEDACARMEKVTLFSYSHGALEVEKVVDTFHDMMMSKGFSDDEALGILGRIFHVSYAPDCPSMFEGQERKIKTVNFLSLQDGLLGDYYKEMYKKILQDQHEEDSDKMLNGVDIRLKGEKKVNKSSFDELMEYIKLGKMIDSSSPLFDFVGDDLSEKKDYKEIHVFTSQLVNKKPFSIKNASAMHDEHNLGILKRGYEMWDLEPLTFCSAEDGRVREVLKTSDNADCISQMMFYSLARGVARSCGGRPIDDMTQMKNALVNIRDTFSQDQLLKQDDKLM